MSKYFLGSFCLVLLGAVWPQQETSKPGQVSEKAEKAIQKGLEFLSKFDPRKDGHAGFQEIYRPALVSLVAVAFMLNGHLFSSCFCGGSSRLSLFGIF